MTMLCCTPSEVPAQRNRLTTGHGGSGGHSHLVSVGESNQLRSVLRKPPISTVHVPRPTNPTARIDRTGPRPVHGKVGFPSTRWVFSPLPLQRQQQQTQARSHHLRPFPPPLKTSSSSSPLLSSNREPPNPNPQHAHAHAHARGRAAARHGMSRGGAGARIRS